MIMVMMMQQKGSFCLRTYLATCFGTGATRTVCMYVLEIRFDSPFILCMYVCMYVST